mmetsp:Transcript_18374/g.33680  ORF Transcript_18374/g.33680 Transcript_18374/m.33680 type:complete len:645 (-) Transcript_18374:126-2060(-)|eukprot:CAMPEP_0201878138 /NCGR_PEP_ID=MMETSP0902-20130614/9382_1 /ASSEMBLY_ACC=CAM_ASM_000551 /TAXON_ID=420261 /ORGANISM="Thalassiosira antarctica, Strain CCMP982" /LENGTH=644 /DNA_ID=CAMNT_0048405735 /DNA_START=89 /DNA_END=2023 /DNA_ORIENTATION=-
MRFGSEILCLALASSAAAFAPNNSRRSMRMGRDTTPTDLIATNFKLKSEFTLTNTLRWEIRSTLTSEDEAASKTEEPEEEEEIPKFPQQLPNGIYEIQNAKQHNAWITANPDKLMVIKFYAPWCRACKSVEPKFVQISKDKKYENIPIVFGQISVQHNKQYVKSLGIMALPSMQIYAGSEGMVENFPCGPSKIPMLKRKLTETINAKVDPDSFLLKVDCADPKNSEARPCRTRSLAVLDEAQSSEIDEVISDKRKEENLVYLRTGVPFFKDFDDDEFYQLMDKAKLVTFEQGDIVMRQGMEGSVFYVIESGEVEIMVKTAFEDPLTTPPDYLGTIVNVLGPHNYFGERALITHQPRAASIRAIQKTRCFAFDLEDVPSSSVLSGKKQATSERLEEVNSKYGTDVYDIDLISNQLTSVAMASQQRGSVNTPDGVDLDEDYDDYEPPEEVLSGLGLEANDRVISLLVRFNAIRRAAKCFKYIIKSSANFGDAGENRRRALLVNKLTRSQREEFSDLFRIIDSSRDGVISILELRRAMESVGEGRSDEELREMIKNSNPNIDGNEEISKTEFMGVMAEAEFYYLFLDTFEMLDVNKTGYVSAGDLDRVLCGVRDLISDDRMSIIDTADMDMQVDYETYADMLLGKPL